jgi:hypothetical protein
MKVKEMSGLDEQKMKREQKCINRYLPWSACTKCESKFFITKKKEKGEMNEWNVSNVDLNLK